MMSAWKCFHCYQTLYGYRGEKNPGKDLKEGRITDQIQTRGGIFYNMVNPACLIYPEENNCDFNYPYFKLSQYDEMMKFASYKNYNFKIPWYQTLANWISLISFLCLITFLMTVGVRKIYRKKFSTGALN